MSTVYRNTAYLPINSNVYTLPVSRFLSLMINLARLRQHGLIVHCLSVAMNFFFLRFSSLMFISQRRGEQYSL